MKRIHFSILFIILTMLAVSFKEVSAASQSIFSSKPSLEKEYLFVSNFLDQDAIAVKEAINSALQRTSPIFAIIFDVRIEIAVIEGNYSYALLYFYDKDTKELIPTEPGIVLIKRINREWFAYLPDDPKWNTVLNSFPKTIITEELRSFLYQHSPELIPQINAYGGYYLPFPGGVTHTLSRSIGHGAGQSYYAFDFYDAGDRYFDVTASRSGVVWFVKWDVPRDGGDCSTPNTVNYIVIKNDIGLYDVYLHLDYNSIPSHLRVRGNAVTKGEKVGVADNTGCSTGSHLHFMAHTNPNSYWGQSVDITFVDVSVCGGRPRTPGEDSCAVTNAYTSGNYWDTTPPTSSITLNGTLGDNSWYRSTVSATISATDNISGVSYSQYNLNGAGWINYSTPISVSNNGTNVLQYRSVDKAGNWEIAKSTTFKIDTEVPSNPTLIDPGCNAQNNTWQNTCRDPSFSWGGANDAISGISGYQYYWGTDPTGVGSNNTIDPVYDPWPVVDGTDYLRIRTIDNAGNLSSWVTLFVLRYDGTSPEGTIILNEGWELTHRTRVWLYTEATDSTSGVHQFRIRNVNESWTDWIDIQSGYFWYLPPATDVLHSVEVEIQDNAGNSYFTSDSIFLDIYPDQPTSTNYTLTKNTFGVGGMNSISANYRLQGTLAQQSIIGLAQSENYQVSMGFWYWIYDNPQSNGPCIYLPLIIK